MLYVFYVSTGTMMTFDMKLAMASVATLQVAIEKKCGISVESQVLLISGGATLDSSVQVCNYGAGMDTNPIFLFSKYANETYYPSLGFSDSDSDLNMKERVEACGSMAVDYQTLTARSQLARDFADIALRESGLCSDLVNSQHLQQQGWAAVVANLEDTIIAFKRHGELLQTEAQQYFQSRPIYQDLLQKFPEAVDLLAKVPIIRPLNLQDESEDANSKQEQTLLTRYCTEPRAALEKMAEQCNKWIYQFDENTLAHLNEDMIKIMYSAEEPSVKEVKGIEDRLFQLNKLMESAKELTDNQNKFAESLGLNHTRVTASNDTSVLLDLCKIHQEQLGLMLVHHIDLRDIRDKLAKSKHELCENLNARIIWITRLQSDIFQFNNKVAIYRENLRRLIDHLDVIQQIHLAPVIYVKTLAEIHRRKNFSTRFLKWAKSLSEQALDLYSKEGRVRKAFSSSRTENFVNSLFPGMDDLPPTFATQCPDPFDQLLPDISQEDLEALKNQLPELSDLMEVVQPEQMPTMSHKSMVTDSAFSSEVPSSQAAAPSGSCGSLQGGQLLRTETLSSFGAGECAGPMSPTSSPFEEPFLPPPTDMEVAIKHTKPSPNKKTDEGGTECKRLHLTEGVAEKEMFSPIVEEQNNVESDGDEFERVDDVPKLYDAFVTCSETSDSNDEEGNKHKKCRDPVSVPPSDAQAEISKVHKGDVYEPCPMEERLRTPDSMVTSHDFQSPDYFIDDSMPSSYTESTGTSALGRAQQRVKSHHVIVAELQHQLDEKHSALVVSQGSVKMSRSNILLHGKISALQRYVQEVQTRMKSDLQLLRDHVTEQRSTVTEEISGIMMNVGTAITDVLNLVDIEKENAVTKAVQQKEEMYDQIIKQNNEKFQNEIIKLQTEINECNNEIANYKTSIDKMKQDHEIIFQQAVINHKTEKAEILKGLMLEHELELESLREETAQNLQFKEHEIAALTAALSEKQTYIHMLGIERENIEADLKQKLLRDQELWMESTEATYKAKYKRALQNALEEHQNSEKERIEIWSSKLTTIEERFQKELNIKLEEKEAELKANFEKEKRLLSEQVDCMLKAREQEYIELREKANTKHLQELESMHTQFRLTYNTTAMDRTSTDSIQGSPLSTEDHPMSFEKDLCDLSQKLTEAAGPEIPGSVELLTSELLKLKDRYERMKRYMQKQHDAKIDELKAQQRAKQQVGFNESINDYFNEAMNEVIGEKDKSIEELQSRILFLERKIENSNTVIKSHFEKDMKRMAVSTSGETHHTGAKSKIQKFQDASKTLLEVRNIIDTPLMSTVDSSFMEDKLRDLERELELEKLKVQSLSMFDQKKESTDKLSVLTCNKGDIVLFFYDEKYTNYIAFQYGPAPHFLHPDSLVELSLKMPPEAEASWALTVVLDKEYCQARKPGNRYKVLPGSKFYRVKVKAWDHEEARQRMMRLPVTALSWVSSASISTSTTVASASAADTTNSSHMSSSAI